MIIVSQDKSGIVNFNNISTIYTLEKKVIVLTNNTDKITLGKYATEERAEEILQEIITTYRNTEAFKYTEKFEIQEGITGKLNQSKLQLFNYQMPEV